MLYRGIVSNLLWDVDGISKSETRLLGALLGLAFCVSAWDVGGGFGMTRFVGMMGRRFRGREKCD